MKARTASRLVKPLATGLAVAAMLAPAAQAQEQYSELYGTHGRAEAGQQHQSATPYGALYQHEFLANGTPAQLVQVPIEQAYAEALEATQRLADGTPAAPVQVPAEQAYADALEATQRLAPDSLPLALRPTKPANGHAFDYRDAGVGASIALGAALLAAAAFGLRRRGLAHS